jgi:uncharacterized coiled-coil DUF342 family protein
MTDELIYRTLMEMNTKLGQLAEGAEARRSQVTTLFNEVQEMRGELTTLKADFRSHANTDDGIAAKVEAIETDIRDNIKPVTAILSNAKAKGLAVLAFIALMGGTAGGQAEKILAMILGRPG